MRARFLSLSVRPASPPVAVGILFVVASTAAETLVVYPLRQVAPEISLGVVYLPGVLVVSSVWGLALGVMTAVLSTAAFDFFHVSPVGSIVFGGREGQAALVILLAVALVLSCVAALARSRAIEADAGRQEADERRREADLAAGMARLLLRTSDLRAALPEAAARLARALGLPAATIELEPVAAEQDSAAFPLRGDGVVLGTLLVPAGLALSTQARIRERVVPSVAALLRAAHERETMSGALEASRDQLGTLAAQQAGLRRVATLVARGAAPESVFAAVVKEIGQLLQVDFANMCRYDPEDTLTVVAAWGEAVEPFPVGSEWRLGGRNLGTVVSETGRPARIDGYAEASGAPGTTAARAGFRSAVATPIVVEGGLWGVVVAGSTLEQALPVDSEARLASFTELLATAIANAESRASLARLAEEQAALRRVATLVAHGVPPAEVFAAVTEEVVGLFELDSAAMARYEDDATMTMVAITGRVSDFFSIGRRWSLRGKNVSTLVFETGRPGRIDSYAEATDDLGSILHNRGMRSAVGSPIMVDGRLWGVISASSAAAHPLPADTEERLASFTELVATAIANAQSRAELTASRARIVAAADETRRQIERDLHDGIQQQLVSLMLELRTANATRPPDADELSAALERTDRALERAVEELREISRGIHPAVLSKGGLRPALAALARRSVVPIELDLCVERRLPEPVEVAAYYAVSEALTNVAKHAQASRVQVEIEAGEATMRLAIRDDGIGGAQAGPGSGLVGLSDRIDALGGTLAVTSPTGGGTTILIEIPLLGQSGAESPAA
jgi:signal transduction histidine kinase